MKKLFYKTRLKIDFENALKKVKTELKKEGFGILTEVNVKEKFKEKLDLDYNNYVILGACNPKFAFKVLEIEKDIGIFLPCKVIVYQDNNLINVTFQKPSIMSDFFQNEKMKKIAEEVESKLKQAFENTKEMEE